MHTKEESAENYFEFNEMRQQQVRLRLAILIKGEYEDLVAMEEWHGNLYEYFIHKLKEAEEDELYGTAQAIKDIIDGANRQMDR